MSEPTVPMEVEQGEAVQIQEIESTTSVIPERKVEIATSPMPEVLAEDQPVVPPDAESRPEVEPVVLPSNVEEATVAEPERPVTPPKPKITIYLKTSKDKLPVQVEENSAIRDIKITAAEKFAADPDYLCLIFSGKMMEDDDTLETHNIGEGMTIHLIIKTAPRIPDAGPQRPPADISQSPFGIGNVGGLAGLESLGLGSSNFMELQNRLQTELIGNPELLRRVLDNPLVQTMMNDPDNMKELIKNNPQMQELMRRHPEIRTMLNNQELLKNTAELARNPSMLQELMRNLDGSNPMEGSTTTFTTLPDLFSSYQEPRLSSASAKVKESQKKKKTDGVFNNPQMSSLMGQMCENPQLVQNMMTAPYTQAMLQAMSANPQMAAAIVTENPLYRNNPALQQHITSMMPQMLNQLQNPEVMNMMANPQAVSAMMQIQEGMDQLRNVAPGLMSNLSSFLDVSGAQAPGTSTSASGSAPKASPATNPLTPGGDNFSCYMAQMVAQMAQNDPRLPPGERYKVQMEHLKNMGFNNETDNLMSLTACFGDLNAAVQKLLAQNPKVL